MSKTFKISIRGLVQGVGFRPGVYQLANKLGLKGTVSNDPLGVSVILTGKEDTIERFYRGILKNPPKLSRITSSHIEQVALSDFPDFRIIPTTGLDKLNLQLTPDFGICPNCTAEISERTNRRYGYPFTTCIHCGPRWSITRTFPFEREHTSMSLFEMCHACKNEYINPDDRRFHSQTNSCDSCGISYILTDREGKQQHNVKHGVFDIMAELLREGAIIAIKNTSGYLLCCDASNRDSIAKLRKRKRRPYKPFALLYPSVESVADDMEISPDEIKTLTSPERPILLLGRPRGKFYNTLEEIAPGLGQVGVMLPYSGVLKMLMDRFRAPVIATSGNLHGSPILFDQQVAVKSLGEVADYFFAHDLDILNPQDDSVIRYTHRSKRPILLRRSRGFAPSYLEDFPGALKGPVLALGAHLKSTIAFIPNDYLYISQYIGNLDNYEVFERFVSVCRSFTELFDTVPSTILIDKHPSYQSSLHGKQLAGDLGAKLVTIQHHKAHFAALLGERSLFNLGEPVLGVVWDGTGYGDDGNIWGAEFFCYANKIIKRVGHFEYFDWMAGDRMAREPRLSLFSLMGNNDHVHSKFRSNEVPVLLQLKDKNKLKTSSAGRLIDAVASLLGLCDINSYEAEAAMKLENLAREYDLTKCRSYISDINGQTIAVQDLIEAIYQDKVAGVPRRQLAANFFYSLASSIFLMAKNRGYAHIAFSGGVFQNAVLVDMIHELAPEDIKLYFHKDLSPNDENISFGQLMYYLNCSG